MFCPERDSNLRPLATQSFLLKIMLQQEMKLCTTESVLNNVLSQTGIIFAQLLKLRFYTFEVALQYTR